MTNLNRTQDSTHPVEEHGAGINLDDYLRAHTYLDAWGHTCVSVSCQDPELSFSSEIRIYQTLDGKWAFSCVGTISDGYDSLEETLEGIHQTLREAMRGNMEHKSEVRKMAPPKIPKIDPRLLTPIEALEHSIELWQWLTKTGKLKGDWPEWKCYKHRPLAECFLCEIGDCDQCPMFGAWGSYPTCTTDFDAPYLRWKAASTEAGRKAAAAYMLELMEKRLAELGGHDVAN